MKFYKAIFLLIVMISPLFIKAQENPRNLKISSKNKMDTLRVAITEENGEMIPWISIAAVDIYSARKWRSPQEQAAFNRLKYNVLKVMPYAIYAKNRYARLESEIAVVTDKRAQKKLVKQCDKEIKDLFNREIKELTITQGQILTKLIDREVGKSTFQIVKETQGGFTAFIYQSVARVIGHNLKSTYSPKEDRDIESIITNSGYYN